ncbi:hypothetical protein [Kitasatospora sp. GP82]|uniref:hypothetical protein n=1 Tax=Kitasatospora sp. GP82 TaxID=3035089 RepID=UPI002476F555|nr:hypothetical protein [Kitasatospora sp. GP82]
MRDSQHAVRLVWLGGEVGCFRLESSLGNVGDATKPDDTVGYPFGRPVEGEQACGTVDDPYWSH